MHDRGHVTQATAYFSAFKIKSIPPERPIKITVTTFIKIPVPNGKPWTSTLEIEQFHLEAIPRNDVY